MTFRNKYLIFIIFSLLVLLFFLFFNNFLIAPRQEINETEIQQINSDPLITKAHDFYASFIRTHNLISQNGDLKILIFCDFTNPDCKDVWQNLQDIRNLSVSIAWKNFPNPSNQVSQSVSRAAICASQQNAFWQYADLLFKNQDDLNELDLINFARQLDLDFDKFETCFNNENILELIGQDMEDTQRLQVNNFPYAIVGSVRFDMDKIEDIKNVILSELPGGK